MPKSPKKVPKEQPTSDKSLKERLEDYENEIKELKGIQSELLSVVKNLTLEVQELRKMKECSCSEETFASKVKKETGPDPSPEYVQFLALKFMQSREIHSKDNNIVLVGFKKDTTNEEEACRKAVKDAGLADTAIESVFRHSRKNGQPTSIIKVKLSSTVDKDQFKKYLGKSGICSYARDDYSPVELDYDRSLRKFCYEENKKLGLKKYMVINLKKVILKHPKEWIHPQSSSKTQGNSSNDESIMFVSETTHV